METITLKEVVAYMDAGHPFSIMAITTNKREQTGGEELFIAKAWKHSPLKEREREAIANAQPSTGVRKNPNHFKNSTRNLKLPNGQIREVHLRLIRKFNCKTVL